MSELNPLELGETPDDYVELDDGSVEIPGLEAVSDLSSTDFMENLAEVISDHELKELGSELCEAIEKDRQSREKRDEQYREGLERTGLGGPGPGGAEFQGASKVVHPVLAEGCIDFASRAIKELFPAAGPVKSWVNGSVNPQKIEAAGRKTRFMNWQLTTQIKEYRDELEQILTQLPLGGSQYQKFWYDERLKRAKVEFVPIDEIYLPFAASSFYTAQRVTHRQLITRQEYKRRVKSGLYRDVFDNPGGSIPEQSAAAIANDKIEGREDDGYNEDGLRAVLEIYTWRELNGLPDNDIAAEEYAPYIITVDEDTEEVLAIYRNWDEADPTFEKLDWLVEWKFIPWRGAYAIGLPHLIGGLSAALTGSLRALLDSAHINNAATMLKLKSGRVQGQNTSVNVTQVCDIEGPAGIDDVRKLAMPMPFNPPSPVLAGLMDSLYALAKGVVATAEEKIGQIGDRTPVGTTQALIEQGSNTYSAIHARLHESQKKALAILHRINGKYLDEAAVEQELGELTVTREDFTRTMDVIPVSDPTIFSETQRYAQSQAVLQMAQQDAGNPQIPWNQVNVRRRILNQMRIENVDEILPPPKEPITDDVLTENSKQMEGHPLKSGEDQDHLAHIKGHIAFIESPMQLVNPLVPPQALMALFGHIEEHMQMYAARVTSTLASQLTMSQPGLSEDAILAQATQDAQVQVTQELAPVLQKIVALQQQVQKRIPPPPPPPEIAASIQIAQMDTQRKEKLDQGTLQLKAQEMQGDQQRNMAEFQLKQQAQQADQARTQAELQMKAAAAQFQQQMEASKEQFNQMIEQSRLRQEEMATQLAQQVEMMTNQADNHQKQMTELLKNRDDNETKVLIEQMSQQMATLSETASSPTGDLAPQMDQLNRMLDQIGKDQTNTALTSVMEGLRATIETLNKPKQIVRDASGKAIGVQSV